MEALEAQNTDEARGRIENIREFLGVVREYADDHEVVFDPDILDIPDVDNDELAFHAPTLGDFMEWLRLANRPRFPGKRGKRRRHFHDGAFRQGPRV